MNAVLREERRLAPMPPERLGEVLAIESTAYAFPWTPGNFADSLRAGYRAELLLDSQNSRLLGYYVAMQGVGEMHLLNITVAPAEQHRGHARFMLDALCAHCRPVQAGSLWLEVRESNLRARAIYERYGFETIGVRRAYYPASRATHVSGREDATVMRLLLELGGRDGME